METWHGENGLANECVFISALALSGCVNLGNSPKLVTTFVMALLHLQRLAECEVTRVQKKVGFYATVKGLHVSYSLNSILSVMPCKTIKSAHIHWSFSRCDFTSLGIGYNIDCVLLPLLLRHEDQ